MSSNSIMNELWSVFYKYSNFKYEECDIHNYKIKTEKEFEKSNCGICWDFVGPMSNDLMAKNIKHHCYFTYVYKDDKLLATHTYIIAFDEPFHFWIECAWQNHKGVCLVHSYKDVERHLKEFYNSRDVHTLIYNPNDVYGKTADQLFRYLEKNGVEMS